MNTKAISLTIVFTALTVALNPNLTGIFLAAPYAPFLIYQIWEIPIVAACLLVNFKSGVAIAGLNSLVLLAFFQGVSPLGPFYNLVAILSMLLGVFIAYKLFTKKLTPTEGISIRKYTALGIAFTAFGVAMRTGVMSLFNYVTLRFEPPIGYALQEPAILGYYLPATSIFNATLAMYTIPLAYLIAVVVKRNLKHV